MHNADNLYLPHAHYKIKLKLPLSRETPYNDIYTLKYYMYLQPRNEGPKISTQNCDITLKIQSCRENPQFSKSTSFTNSLWLSLLNFTNSFTAVRWKFLSFMHPHFLEFVFLSRLQGGQHCFLLQRKEKLRLYSCCCKEVLTWGLLIR